MNKALIVAAGTVDVFPEDTYGLIVCADGGYDKALDLGLRPDVFVGDMDSVKKAPSGLDNILLPVQKDLTDTEAAIIEAMRRGFSDMDIIGGTGTRFDHTAANVMLTKKYLRQGVRVQLLDEHNRIFAVEGTALFTGEAGTTCSFLPGDSVVYGVTLEGFEYPLTNEDVVLGETRTISNRIVSERATVTIKEGVLFAVLAKD